MVQLLPQHLDLRTQRGVLPCPVLIHSHLQVSPVLVRQQGPSSGNKTQNDGLDIVAVSCSRLQTRCCGSCTVKHIFGMAGESQRLRIADGFGKS